MADELGKLNKYMGGLDDAAEFLSPSDRSAIETRLQDTVQRVRNDQLLRASHEVMAEIQFIARSLRVPFEIAFEIYPHVLKKLE